MRLFLLVFSAGAALVSVTGEARAQGCPEGDWFCEDPPQAAEAAPEPQEPAHEEAQAEPAPAAPQAPATAPEVDGPEETEKLELPVQRRPRRRWGLDVHALGALIAGSRAHPDAGMGGVGFGVRYRPLPLFAFDGSVELAFGTDYNGLKRSETALLANALAFFNLRQPFQPYILAGVGISSAEVTGRSAPNLPAYYSGDERYTYFGMQMGVGAELRLTRRAALRLDILGFVRGRVAGGGRVPEFIDPETRRATNTSGGSFARAGGVFYF